MGCQHRRPPLSCVTGKGGWRRDADRRSDRDRGPGGDRARVLCHGAAHRSRAAVMVAGAELGVAMLELLALVWLWRSLKDLRAAIRRISRLLREARQLVDEAR